MPFTVLDLIAIAWFVGAWMTYAIMLEYVPRAREREGLNARMNRYREVWMRQMLGREVRIVDAQILAALQNGTAFFASSSLLALGGTLAMLRSSDEILNVMATLPLGIQMSRVAWEMKTAGLAVIFVYAFFKFGWPYRLFNYVAILLGATPPVSEKDTPEAESHVKRTAGLFAAAGRHFNHGQRAFFFALGYLGWFISPLVLILSTAAVVFVMWWRQFGSDARKAMDA